MTIDDEYYKQLMEWFLNGDLVLGDTVGLTAWRQNIEPRHPAANFAHSNRMQALYGEEAHQTIWDNTWDKAVADYRAIPLIGALL